jgi:hypothetical protein
MRVLMRAHLLEKDRKLISPYTGRQVPWPQHVNQAARNLC